MKVKFIKENLSFSGEPSPMAQLMLSVIGTFAEFEKTLIRERQHEDVALAKVTDKCKGRKKWLSLQDVEHAKEQTA